MTYNETRESEQLRFLDGAIELFIAQYKLQPPNSRRQTIIFFPGGLASKLMRAKTPYRVGVTDPQSFDYDEAWLTVWTFGPSELNALKLKMHKDATDRSYHDEDERIILANGSIKFGGVTPYDDFVDWCKSRSIDLFVFGWDWRRPLEETADFFLNKFLPRFGQAVKGRCDPDPLEQFTLMGHSFGGLVVKLILGRCDSVLAGKIKKAITVATPFYGYGGQIHRWFEGEELLNHLGKPKVINTLSSLPASYTLNWLDEGTFNRDRDALSADPEFPLRQYPSVDRKIPAQLADPYNPRGSGTRVRYPRNLGFDQVELDQGGKIYRQLAGSLPADRADKFFNIRGVQSLDGSDASATINKTINSTTWDLIEPDFDPQQPSPIEDGALGPGDQVLPAWSTHLATLPPGNRKTVKGLLHHSFILSSSAMQDQLAELLGVAPAVQPRSLSLPDSATLQEAVDFVEKLHNTVRDLPLDRLGPESFHVDAIFETALGAVAGIRAMLSEDGRRRIARRIIMELCK
jgi:hypothetical protein